MKKGMDRYALKKRLQQKGYLRKYRNGNPAWKTPETSCSDSIQQSRESQEEINQGLSLNLQEIKQKEIEWYGKFIQLTEEVIKTGEQNEERREEESVEASEGRQKRIQRTNKRRSKTKKIVE